MFSIQLKSRKRRARTVQTKHLIRKVWKNFVNNIYKKSSRKLAKEHNCGHTKIVNVIRYDLGLRSYKKIVVSQLNDYQIIKRFRILVWIKNHFDRIKCQKIAFSDEKIFDGDNVLNSKNDVAYATSRKEATAIGWVRPKQKFR